MAPAPAPRSRRLPRAPRALATAALLWGAAYLTWRVGWTMGGVPAWLSVPLLAAETWMLVRLALFALSAWHVPGAGPRPGPSADADEVELLVPTAGADVEELARTLVVARACGFVRVRVLDARDREAIRAEAARHGASYEVHPGRDAAALVGAALSGCTTELAAWVDAGDVPTPGLVGLVGVFEDPDVAVVQCATDWVNPDSLLHTRPDHDEHALWDRVLGPALGPVGAAPWTGSGSVLRVADVARVGGLPDGAASPTIRTSMRLQRRGRRVRFCAEPLVRSVAPDTLDAYLRGVAGRAAGGWQVLVGPGTPLLGRGLGIRRRLAAVHLTSGALDGLARATFLAVLAAVLVSGRVPLQAGVAGLALLWLPAFALRAAATVALGRGTLRPGDPTRRSLRELGPDLAALVGLADRRVGTVAGGNRDRRPAVLGRLPLVTAAAVVLNAALLARLLTFWHPDLLPPFTDAQRLAVMAATVWTLVPLVDVLGVLARRRQRRATHRVATDLVLRVDGRPARAVDLTPAGLGAVVRHDVAVGDRLDVGIGVPRADGSWSDVAATAVVSHAAATEDGRLRIGARFTALEQDTRDALVEYCALTAEHRAVARSVPDADPDDLAVPEPGLARRTLAVLNVAGLLAAGVVVMAGPAAAQDDGTPTSTTTTSTAPPVTVEDPGAVPPGTATTPPTPPGPAAAASAPATGTGHVTGQVFDPDGLPAAEVCVGTVGGPEDAPAPTGLTGVDGSFVLEDVPAGTYRVWADDCGRPDPLAPDLYIRTYAPDTPWADRSPALEVTDASTTAVAISMVPGGRVTGRVVDERGRAVDTACVQYVDPSDPRAWNLVGATADGGRFDVAVPAAEGRVVVSDCSAEQRFSPTWYPGATDEADAEPVATGAGGELDLGELVVTLGAVVSGQVTDTSGDPLAGVCVSAQVVSDTSWEWKGGGSTGPDGTYRFRVAPGTYSLYAGDCSAASGWHVPVWYPGVPTSTATPPTVEVAAGGNPAFDLQLRTGGRLAGTVLAPDGGPADGVCVSVHPDRPTFEGLVTVAWARAAADGSWTSGPVAAGRYLVHYGSCDDTGAWRTDGPWLEQFHHGVVVGPDLDWAGIDRVTVRAGRITGAIEETMTAAARLSGVVRGPGGVPAADVCVTGRGVDADLRSAADGTFSLVLPPGTHQLTFTDCRRGRGLVQQRRTVAVPAGRTDGPNVDLQAGTTGALSGSVRNGTGLAIRPACVVAYVPDAVVGLTTVGRDGTWSIDGLGPGSYYVGVFGCDDDARVVDPRSGVSYAPRWWRTGVVDLSHGAPDPAAQGARAVTIPLGGSGASLDFCFGGCATAPSTPAPPPGQDPAPRGPATTPTEQEVTWLFWFLRWETWSWVTIAGGADHAGFGAGGAATGGGSATASRDADASLPTAPTATVSAGGTGTGTGRTTASSDAARARALARTAEEAARGPIDDTDLSESWGTVSNGPGWQVPAGLALLLVALVGLVVAWNRPSWSRGLRRSAR